MTPLIALSVVGYDNRADTQDHDAAPLYYSEIVASENLSSEVWRDHRTFRAGISGLYMVTVDFWSVVDQNGSDGGVEIAVFHNHQNSGFKEKAVARRGQEAANPAGSCTVVLDVAAGDEIETRIRSDDARCVPRYSFTIVSL